MKTSFNFLTAFLLTASFCLFEQAIDAQTNTFPSSGSAGIGTTTPNASSALEIKSTTQGLLISRMTKAQRNLISAPASGLMIYQKDSTPGFYYYSGSVWKAITPNSKNWALTGNAGTNPATNYLGTTDFQPLSFRLNNQKSGIIECDSFLANTALGYQCFSANLTGHGNVSIGYRTLQYNTTGYNNTASGYEALRFNTTGIYNTANANGALYYNTTGNFNTADGHNALGINTTGNNNTAYGESALYSNKSGSYLVAIGDSAMYNQNGGTGGNTAIGSKALYSNTTGGPNTANGYKALYFNTTGSRNTANGYQALYSNTIGVLNTACGYFALLYNTTGIYNTANGSNALEENNIGAYNTANGANALSHNSTGFLNTANGYNALTSNTTGYSNTAIGQSTLFSNKINSNLVAVGDSALYHQNGGSGGNAAVGSKTLLFNTTGAYNTASGNIALYSNTTGNNNTANGYQALYFNTTGSNNTAVGYGAYPADGTVSNYTGIGYNVGTNASTSNMVEIGNTSVTVIRGQVNFSTYSDQRIKNNIKENVPGLAFINLLKPVTYHLDIHKQNQLLYTGKTINGANKDANFAGKYNIEQQQMTGFLAQDVKKAAETINYNFSGIVEPQNEHDLYSLRYSDFVIPLVKAVQELSNQNDSLKNANNKIQSQLDALIKRMDALETAQQQCCSKSAGSQQSAASNQQKVIRNNVSTLEQNIPNPFNGSCTISYYIPVGNHTAQLSITDVSGHVLKKYSLITSGNGKQIISGNELKQGVYAYSLWVDGKLIDTKKMQRLQ